MAQRPARDGFAQEMGKGHSDSILCICSTVSGQLQTVLFLELPEMSQSSCRISLVHKENCHIGPYLSKLYKVSTCRSPKDTIPYSIATSPNSLALMIC